MRGLFAKISLALLLCSMFAFSRAVAGGATSVVSEDSLQILKLYTEGLKAITIYRDTTTARTYFEQALEIDSTYAPVLYSIVSNSMYSTTDEAVELSKRAYDADTTNGYYQQIYAQSLVYARRYDDALAFYKSHESDDPNHYRILAALYEQNRRPLMALAVLDSAQLRFGRQPLFSTMKRELLIATGQIDRAIVEAKSVVEAMPYDIDSHLALARIYSAAKQDEDAEREFFAASKIDSTNINLLNSWAQHYGERGNDAMMLGVVKRIFSGDALTIDAKVKRFEDLTSNMQFYRNNYLQINEIASLLAIRYPNDNRVVELYATHLIASGELEQALQIYKNHINGGVANEKIYRAVIDIEGYLQRPDSVNLYADRALQYFPNNIDFHLAKGHVMSIMGRFERATKIYKGALKYTKKDSVATATILGYIGDTWHQKALSTISDNRLSEEQKYQDKVYQKVMRKSFKAYSRSLKYQSHNAMVLNNYAYFLSLENRELERALEMISLSVEIAGNNPTYLDTYAWVLYKLGRYEEAKKIIQQAVALDASKSEELLLHYGDILFALEERFLAEIYWKRALEAGYDSAAVLRRLEMIKK